MEPKADMVLAFAFAPFPSHRVVFGTARSGCRRGSPARRLRCGSCLSC
jgi:hypothetical protein